MKNSIVFWISSNGGTIDKASNDKAEYYVTVKVRHYYDQAIYDNGNTLHFTVKMWRKSIILIFLIIFSFAGLPLNAPQTGLQD